MMTHEKGTWEEYQRLVLGELERLERNALTMQTNINQMQADISHSRAKIIEILDIKLEDYEKSSSSRFDEQTRIITNRFTDEMKTMNSRVAPLEASSNQSKGGKQWITWILGIIIAVVEILNYINRITPTH